MKSKQTLSLESELVKKCPRCKSQNYGEHGADGNFVISRCVKCGFEKWNNQKFGFSVSVEWVH